MDSTTDMTPFWLAWHRTCAIRLCTKPHMAELYKACADNPELLDDADNITRLAEEIIGITNSQFKRAISKPHGLRHSQYEADVASWNEQSQLGSAFEIMEGRLYAREKINGRKFKDYLFEDIASRSGGISRNLFGYLQRILATIAEESFGDNVYEPRIRDDGTALPPRRISLDGKTEVRQSLLPQQWLEAKEVVECFKEYMEEHSGPMDDDGWICLFCILNMMPIGGARVRPLLKRKHEAANSLCNRIKRELLHVLRQQFSVTAIGAALNGPIQTELEKKIHGMPFFHDLQNIFENERKIDGK